MYSAVKFLLRLGWSIWVRALGEKRAKKFVIAGFVLSTIAAFVLEVTT